MLPHLDGASSTLLWDDLRVKSKDWAESIPEPVELVSDSPERDWPWIAAIFPVANDWPSNSAHEPISLLFNTMLPSQDIEGLASNRPRNVRPFAN